MTRNYGTSFWKLQLVGQISMAGNYARRLLQYFGALPTCQIYKRQASRVCLHLDDTFWEVVSSEGEVQFVVWMS